MPYAARGSACRSGVLFSSLLALFAMHAAAVSAQAPADLNALAGAWLSGSFASPVLCEIGGENVRGRRRIHIAPERGPGRPPLLTLQFVDMQVEDASRCMDSTGNPLPNVIGKLRVRIAGPPHPETAARDFRDGLRRDRGFDFEIVDGVLRIQEVGLPPAVSRDVEFRGGKAGFHTLLPATDAERELREFQSPQKLLLELEARDGSRLALPLYRLDRR